MVLQTVDVAGFWRFGICDAVSIFLPAVSRLFPIFPVYVALFFWFISSRISLRKVPAVWLFGGPESVALFGRYVHEAMVGDEK